MPPLTAKEKFLAVAEKYGFSLFGVPKSGQLFSYELWDDGYYQTGYPKKGPRFIDNQDGTITDMGSALMWVKQPEKIGILWNVSGNPAVMTWQDALINCASLNYAGYYNWRLPNVKELLALVHHEFWSPAIYTLFFPNTQKDRYWTSTTYANDVTLAWFVQFAGGFTDHWYKVDKDFVRPVRCIF